MPEVTQQVTIIAKDSQGLSLAVQCSSEAITWQCVICYKKKQAPQLAGSICSCLLETPISEMYLELPVADLIRTS